MTEQLNGQEYEPVEFGWEEEKANSSLSQRSRFLGRQGIALGSDSPFGSSTRVVDLRSPERDTHSPRRKQIASEYWVERRAKQSAKWRGPCARLIEREVPAGENSLAAIGADSVVTLAAADERLRLFRHPTRLIFSGKKL